MPSEPLPTNPPEKVLDWVYPPQSMMWRVGRERAVLVAGPAAAVLQVAHPRIALGVAQHSDFTNDAIGRLNRTMATVNKIVFGTQQDAAKVRQRMVAMHQRVRGDADAAGVAGPPQYHGLEPDLLMWVLATLCIAGITGYEWALGKELTLLEMEEYYGQIRQFGQYFDLDPAYGPQGWQQFQAYYAEMLRGDVLASNPVCAEQARHVIFPANPLWARHLGGALSGLSTAFIPEPVRTKLGLGHLPWSPSVVANLGRFTRTVVPVLPARLRYMPEYLAARKLLASPSAR